jgi:hypothetical protein
VDRPVTGKDDTTVKRILAPILAMLAWLVELHEIATDFLSDWLSRFVRRVSLVAVLVVVGGVTYKLATASRNSSGTYTTPSTFVAGNVISAASMNANFADLATEMTDSLDRSGKGPMLAPLRITNGTFALPSLTFDTDTDTGIYRIGANNLGVTAAGAKVLDVATTGLGVTGALSITNTGSAAANAATFFEASLANGNSFALRLGKADTGASDGVGFYYTANATAANSKGCVAVSGQTDTLCVDGNGLVKVGGSGFGTGIAGDGSGFKHKRFGSSCATLAVAGNTCTSTLTWVTAFADANYTVTCTGQGPAGVPLLTLNTHVAASATINVTASTAVIASFTEVDCIAVHD